MGYRHLEYKFKRYKGQPIEVITESGMKYCGTLISVNNEGIDILDCKERVVHVENRHVEAIIEPRMKLQRLCKDNDCCCKDHCNENDHSCDRECGNGGDYDNDLDYDRDYENGRDCESDRDFERDCENGRDCENDRDYDRDYGNDRDYENVPDYDRDYGNDRDYENVPDYDRDYDNGGGYESGHHGEKGHGGFRDRG